MDFLKEESVNIKTFSSKEAVEAYSKKYLRFSEKSVIDNFMKPGNSILDVGCGAGRTTEPIFEKGCRVIGIDIAEPLIVQAKKLHPVIDFRVMDAADLDFPNNAFDVVFFSFNGLDNFYPLERRLEAIKELRRVLKPEGFFVYSSHNSLNIPRTRAGLSILAKNLKRFRIGPHWREEDHGFGKLVQYYNNIWNEEQQTEKLGFELAKILANGRINSLPKGFFAFFEKFPMYVFRKI